MSKKHYYRTRYTIDVLSEDPIPEGANLLNVLREADTGEYVAHREDTTVEELTGKQMADELHKAGSEPGFFMLNDEGEEAD